MSVLFTATYIVLWIAVAVIGLVLVGVLRQIGTFELRTDISPSSGPAPAMPALPDDGPPLESAIPDLELASANGYGKVMLRSQAAEGKRFLLVFLSPMCEGCQQAIEPLNQFARYESEENRVVAIMRADEQACRAFCSVFPVAFPLICDSTRRTTWGFDIHRNPFALLYENGILARKGVALTQNHLAAILGDADAATLVGEEVYPKPQSELAAVQAV